VSEYHPSVQPIAVANTDTGECGERRPSHSEGEAEKLYRELKAEGCRVRVGMEARGHGRWFERLPAQLGFELWIGDPAQFKAKRMESRRGTAWMPRCCWRIAFRECGLPSAENRDLRQLLWHRHRLVQMRTRITNQLPAVAMNEGVRRKQAL